MLMMWPKIAAMIFLTVLNVYFFATSSGENCLTIDGTWYSDLGQLSLSHTKEGLVLGNYISAVKDELGSSSNPGVQSDVIGAAARNGPTVVFGFGVMWNSGASIKSWTGQCVMCGDDEALETTWLLRQRVDNCSESYQSKNIGKTVFTRKRPGNDRNPQRTERNTDNMRRWKRDVTSDGEATSPTRNVCSLIGNWYNQLGSNMYISEHQDTTFVGKYWTAVERRNGSSGTGHSKLYGMANALDPTSTIVLYVVWNNGTSVTGWVGQCHLCGENQTETLLTSWVLWAKVNSCIDTWHATLYGEDTFTRYEQKPRPR